MRCCALWCRVAGFFYKQANLKIEAAINIFNSLLHSLTILKDKKAKFKVALRKYLNICSFYSLDEFLYVQRRSTVLFCKMFVVLYTANIVYICVLMTCSIPHCLCDTLMNHAMYVCSYVCVCVCVYVCRGMYICMYVCVYVCMYVCVCVYIYIYTYMYLYLCTYGLVCVYVCMYMYVHMHLYVCMYVYLCVYVCNTAKHPPNFTVPQPGRP